MPRASDGTYSLPPGTIVATGDTILPSQHNPAMTDIAAALNNVVPKTGGTFSGAVAFPAGISGSVTFGGPLGAPSLSLSGTLGVTGTSTFGGPAFFQSGIDGPVTFSGAVGA